MTKDIAQLLDSAIKSTGVNYYRFATMNISNLDNDGEYKFATIDLNNDCIHSIRPNFGVGAVKTLCDEKFLYTNAGFPEISDFMVVADRKQMESFLSAVGVELDEDKIHVLRNIDKMRSDGILPITGDYRFRYASEAEYEAMTDEEKERYNEQKKNYELRKFGLAGTAAASIDI